MNVEKCNWDDVKSGSRGVGKVVIKKIKPGIVIVLSAVPCLEMLFLQLLSLFGQNDPDTRRIQRLTIEGNDSTKLN